MTGPSFLAQELVLLAEHDDVRVVGEWEEKERENG